MYSAVGYNDYSDRCRSWLNRVRLVGAVVTTDDLLAFVDKCRASAEHERYDLAFALVQLCGRYALESVNDVLRIQTEEAAQ